jgi:hypothetical protein
MKLPFETLVERLISHGNNLARRLPVQDRVQPTSVRLKSSTLHWLDCQANALGTSRQNVICMILDGVAEMTAQPNVPLPRR